MQTIKLRHIVVLLTILLCLSIVQAVSATENGVDLSYRFGSIETPKSPLGLSWSDFQTNLFSGSSSYSYKLKAPPGISGFQPELSITYNSQSVNSKSGWLGSGWEIPISYIQRNIEYTRKSTSDDTFDLYFNGAKYDLVEAPSDGAGRYRTKVDSYFRIDRDAGAGNSTGEAWVVRTKDGTEYQFGTTNNSAKRINRSDASVTQYGWRWYLEKIVDTNGNEIVFSYTSDPHSNDRGTTYISKIRYNNDLSREIQFINESSDRPDSYLTIDQGSEVRMSRRLGEIKVLVSGALVRSYRLSYAMNAIGSRSLLTSVTQYGKDGISALPATTFSYQPFSMGFNSGVAWANSNDIPVRETDDDSDRVKDLFDVNGDGLPDRVHFSGSSWKIRMNTGSGFESSEVTWGVPGSSWAIRQVNTPDKGSDAADTKSAPMDLNRDGYVDFIWADGVDIGGKLDIRFGTGNGFGGYNGWSAPHNDISIRRVRDVEDSEPNVKQDIFDINGDGIPDLVKKLDDSTWISWSGTGTSFVGGQWWTPPNTDGRGYLWDYDSSGAHETQIGHYDMNGDGLPDVVDARTSNWKIHLNTGSNYIYAGEWNGGEKYITDMQSDGDVRHDLFDINGDGLPDRVEGNGGGIWKVKFNTGRGFTSTQDWPLGTSLPDNYLRDIKSDGKEVARDTVDLNGDGLVDLVRQTGGNWDVYTNKARKTDLLTGVRESLGGTRVIEYHSSRDYSNTRLPFNFWLVSSVTNDNGMSGSHSVISTTNYSYQGGLYDFPTREFRGFSQVNETKPDGTKIQHYFLQGEGDKGKEFKTTTQTSSSSPLAEVEQTWSVSQTSGIYQSLLSRVDEKTFDGAAANPKTKRTDYELYDIYGNAGLEKQLGDLSIGSDDVYLYQDFVYNPSEWIVDRVKRSRIQAGSNGATLRDTYFYYDNGGLNSSPNRGNLTRKDEWLDSGANPIWSYGHDRFGNQTSVIDPKGNQTSFVFESTFDTYPVKETNALNQEINRSYDPASGNVLSETDPNGNTTSYQYDAFHRLSAMVKPYDAFDFGGGSRPTVWYTYLLNGQAPEGVRVAQNDSNGVLQTFKFTDGFGALIQTQKEAEQSGKFIASDHFYDQNGRVKKQSNPYLINDTSAYVKPNTGIASTSYIYDGLDRPVRVNNPDGTFRTHTFDHWTVTEQDENGIDKFYRFDEGQRPLTIIENNSGEAYTTNYEYSPLGELLEITDHLGNSGIYEYDSLGRKISMDDPDLGVWIYSYDKNGNLISQTDARGITNTLSYDALNRKTLMDYPNDTDVQFTWDQGTIGTLSKVVDATGEVDYEYDARLRKIKETRKLDGFTWDTEWEYDSMDRVVKEIHPNGEIIDYSFNSQGLLDGIPGILPSIDYNVAGQESLREYGNGLVTSFSYQPDNFRLTSLTTPSVQDYGYSYDNSGNITAIADGIENDTEAFTYDDLNRLTRSSSDSYTREYEYNAIGNLTKLIRDGETVNYAHGSGSRIPHAVTQVTSSVPVIQSVKLNDGSEYTVSVDIPLKLSVVGVATDVMVSESHEFSGAVWRSYSDVLNYQLSAGFGSKTVYVKTRNASGESNVMIRHIKLLQDSNGDGLPDVFDVDNDGMANVWELDNGLNPNNASDAIQDADGDGLSNKNEYSNQSDPHNADTDGDGLSDYQEVVVTGTSPIDSDTDDDGIPDSIDPYPLSALNGLPKSESYGLAVTRISSGIGRGTSGSYAVEGILGNGLTVFRSSQQVGQDPDGDGVPLGEDNCPNISNADQANFDGDEQGNACDTDDDNDSMTDIWETANELNPLDASDAELDSDDDGYTNLDEFQVGTDPNDEASFPSLAMPDIRPLSNTFHNRVAVSIGSAISSASIYYTTDGSAPSLASNLYSEPFKLDASATVNAVAALPSGQLSAIASSSFTVLDQSVWSPRPRTSWQWQLQDAVDTSFDVDMYDIDLFDVPQSTIDQLHVDARKVICYFSAGSWEDWRTDADVFPESIKGNELDGWEGEKWLDIREIESLAPIMRARLDMAVTKGCDGVEPDNVDGYINNTGFPLTATDQLTFNLWLTNEANARGLSIGLKNDLNQVSVLEPFYDWALNEQCFQYNECDLLTPFINEGKAVFGVEYELETDAFCLDANARQFSWLKKNYELDALRETCSDVEGLPKFQLENNTWRMISIPADLGENTVSDVFGDDLPIEEYGNTWIVFSYAPGGSYNNVGVNGVLSPGNGYWVTQLTGESVELDIPDDSAPAMVTQPPGCFSGTGCNEIAIGSGTNVTWNMIGNPTPKSISFNSLRTNTNAGECRNGCTLDESEAANYLHNQMWSYPGSGDYQLIQSGGNLSPWEGVWYPALPGSNGLQPKLLVPVD